MNKHILVVFVLAVGLSFWAGTRFPQSPAATPSAVASKPEPPAEDSAGTARKRPKYKARCQFELLDERVLDSNLRLEKRSPDSQWLQSQVKLITSSECLRLAVKAHKLDERWELPPVEAARKLTEALEVVLEPNTSIVTITGYADLTLEAAEFPNAVMDAYEEFRTQIMDEQGRRLIQNTEALIKREQTAIEKLEATPGDGKELAVRQMELKKFIDLHVRQKLEHQVLFKPVRCLETAQPPAKDASDADPAK